ncbi:unnamed protein product [Ceratitis capitata]|uniref:(Mediterranean fruit fly) hypothetical protein n=1 Tax=Ceratitis capitata TaxID=7213 RepID=A0A811UZ29_CERCA|nr:unnamed protein product [Ceratitis capitata]
MDVILPYNTRNRDHFCDCALKIGFHEFVALKFFYTMKDSDLDVFQLMARERLELLLYGWEVCQTHWDELTNKDFVPPYLRTVVKQMMQYSLDIWFSNEWEECKPHFKAMLIVCIRRAKEMLTKIYGKDVFQWDYVLQLGIKPWDKPYLKQFIACNSNLERSLKTSSEHVEAPLDAKDIEHLQMEGPVLILLRLIKLFDAGFLEGARKLSIRTIAAWNHTFKQLKQQTKNERPEVNIQDKRSLILICHIYLMAIYEMDDIRGFVIDNVVNNIRFYYQNMMETESVNESPEEQKEYTAARYIAITCINLNITSNEFIDAFIHDSYDENFVSLFGVVSQSYKSYLLGNLLMEMNKLNEDDFKKRIEDFKHIIHLYIIERERSEIFMLGELNKAEMKRRSHSIFKTKENMTNFCSKMCKGNRLSNIGSSEHTEEGEQKVATLEENSDRRVDPVFQHLPNNEEVLNYVYVVLVKRTHRGWYFGKLIVLLKIIGLQLNAIETWRYHPGLTPEFLLNLEVKLSRHFEDLANIFHVHLFMEQEFWLTGFYLNPCKKYYESVIRSGMRSNRLSHRFETGENYDDEERFETRKDRRDKGDKGEKVNAINAKYGLLSSTIDVKEILKLANHEAPDVDYEQLFKALQVFKLPDNTIKDLLTVIFLPRNKSFAWSLNWVELRKRCKSLLRDAEQKRRFIELNMAEANDRLKFLKVDYEKYKHRPQLDYGSIEQGYENKNAPNFSKDSSDENDDEDSEDFEADSDLDDPAKHEPKKNDHSKLFDDYFMSTRRTRARAAAMIANVLEKDEFPDVEMKEGESKKSTDGTEEAVKVVGNNTDTTTKESKRDFDEILQERTVFDNSTNGFNPFPDIWSLNGQELKVVENKVPHLETSDLFSKSAKLEILKKKASELLNQQKLKSHVIEVAIKQEMEENQQPKGWREDNSRRSSKGDGSNKKQNQEISDAEMHDDESDVSTTARRDSDEINDFSKDEQGDDDKESKSPKKPMQHAKTCIKVEGNSSEGDLEAQASAMKYEKLLEMFTQKKLRVHVRRLRVSDVQKLRQPSVRLKRIDLRAVAERVSQLRRAERKVYVDSDDTTKSSGGSSFIGEHTLLDTLKSRLYSSESSTDSEDYKQKRRINRPTRGRPSGSGVHAHSQRDETKSLKVTPRSASGLKFRISSNVATTSASAATSTKPSPLPIIDYIQISSSSSSDEIDPYSHLEPVQEDLVMEADPLYEEEIAIFRYSQ